MHLSTKTPGTHEFTHRSSIPPSAVRQDHLHDHATENGHVDGFTFTGGGDQQPGWGEDPVFGVELELPVKSIAIICVVKSSTVFPVKFSPVGKMTPRCVSAPLSAT